MSKTTNHFASGFDSVLHKEIVLQFISKRTCSQMRRASRVAHQNQKRMTSQSSHRTAKPSLVLTNKRGRTRFLSAANTARSAWRVHFDDVALDRIAERMDNLTNEIARLNSFIEQMKAAFEQCANDAF